MLTILVNVASMYLVFGHFSLVDLLTCDCDPFWTSSSFNSSGVSQAPDFTSIFVFVEIPPGCLVNFYLVPSFYFVELILQLLLKSYRVRQRDFFRPPR